MTTVRSDKENTRQQRLASLFPTGCGLSPQPGNFAQPLIVAAGPGPKQQIASLPGCFHYPVDTLKQAVAESTALGLRTFALFALPEWRDDSGAHAAKAELVCQAAKEIRSSFEQVTLIADVCVCHYTSHGHCAILDGGTINTQRTLEVLANQALSLANAGVDILMPSGMTTGANAVIRATLDEHGFEDVIIISQVKFASSMYDPFRKEAYATSSVDKSGYQIEITDTSGAFGASVEQFESGADMILIKPAVWSSDIISLVNGEYPGRVGAFCTSGELAMISAAAEAGHLNRQEVLREMFSALRRAGAELIISYQANQYLSTL